MALFSRRPKLTTVEVESIERGRPSKLENIAVAKAIEANLAAVIAENTLWNELKISEQQTKDSVMGQPITREVTARVGMAKITRTDKWSPTGHMDQDYRHRSGLTIEVGSSPAERNPSDSVWTLRIRESGVISLAVQNASTEELAELNLIFGSDCYDESIHTEKSALVDPCLIREKFGFVFHNYGNLERTTVEVYLPATRFVAIDGAMDYVENRLKDALSVGTGVGSEEIEEAEAS